MDRRLLLNISQAGGGGTISSQKVTGAAPATPDAQTLYNDSFFKAWCKKSGLGAPAIDDDLNISSITDNGTGDFTFNFASALANATYANMEGRLANDDGGRWRHVSAYATTSIRYLSKATSDNSLQDGNSDFLFGIVGDD